MIRIPDVIPPSDESFGGKDFLAAPDIEAVGEMLRERHNLPVEPTIRYLWKRKGGTKGGARKRGWCQKLSGPAKHFSGEGHFLVWLAADASRDAKYTQEQYVALIFHELNFVGVDYDEDLNPRMVTRYVDFEGFLEEVKCYGLWEDHLREFSRIAEQAPLWPTEDGGGSGGVSSITLSSAYGSATLTRTKEEIADAFAASRAD